MSTTIEQLRSYRVFQIAVFDLVLSYVGALIVGLLLRLRTVKSWALLLVAWTLFGILIHKALGINTMLGYYLGLNPKP
jgi:hypothetical protein